jgi:hypothetical protein
MYFDNHSPSMLTWLIDPCLDPIAQDQIYGNIYLQLLIFSLKTVFGDDEWMKSDEKIASLNNAASSTLAGSIRWWPCEGCIQYSGWQYSMMAMWRVHPVLWLAVFDDGHVKGIVLSPDQITIMQLAWGPDCNIEMSGRWGVCTFILSVTGKDSVHHLSHLAWDPLFAPIFTLIETYTNQYD